MATQQPPFRYPTQNLDDIELVEDVPIRRAGMTAAEVEAAYGSPHPKSGAHLLVWQEPVAGRDGALSIRRVYRKLPGAALAGTVVKGSTWGAPATVTSQDVAAGAAGDTGLNVLESVVEPKDAQTARKRTTTVPWPTLVSQRLNARGDLETATESKVAPGSALPEATLATAELRLQAETQDRSQLTVTTVASHSELLDKTVGDAALIPARLRAAELYQTTETLVAPTAAPEPLSTSVVASRVTGKTRLQSVKRTTVRLGGTFPGVTDRKLGPDGELLETTETLVDPATVPAGAYGITSDAVRDTGTGVAVRTTTALAAEAFPLLAGKTVEPETKTPVSIVKQIVPAGTGLVADSALIIDQKIQIVDKWRSIQIVTSLDALPGAYSEQKHLSFRFPGLFYGYDPAAGGTVSYRHSVSRLVSARVEISFGYSRVEPVLLEISPVTWSYPLGFNASDVLTNGEHFEYTAQGVDLSLDVPASTPSRSAYEALIGTEANAAGVSERWKGGVWRTEIWKIKLQ